jgi:hypothetical protein
VRSRTSRSRLQTFEGFRRDVEAEFSCYVFTYSGFLRIEGGGGETVLDLVTVLLIHLMFKRWPVM